MAEGKKGFTLIELIAVIAICGILTAVSLPLFSRFAASFLLTPSARGIASELRKTQTLALSRHQTLAWNISQSDLAPGIFPGNEKTFIFSASGFPPPGGSGTQYLNTATGGGKKIIVSSAGRVRIE
jgi:prepilin-type N-terminal cleavage/methylation domain-containing protein